MFQVQVKYFIVSLPRDEKALKHGEHTLSIERKQSRTFSDFSYDFKDFRQVFRVHFLICPFSQEWLDESY